MTPGFLGIPWLIWGGIALLIGLIFVVYVPNADKINAVTGWRFIVVRWFHSVCWFFIALNFFLRAVDNLALSESADMIALLGGFCYLAYITVFIRVTRT